MTEKSRIQNQDEWKRTQIRIPKDIYDSLVEYAERNNLSLNTAMLELMDKGLSTLDGDVFTLSQNDSNLFGRMIEGLKQIEQTQNELVKSVEQLKLLYPEDKERLNMLDQAIRGTHREKKSDEN